MCIILQKKKKKTWSWSVWVLFSFQNVSSGPVLAHWLYVWHPCIGLLLSVFCFFFTVMLKGNMTKGLWVKTSNRHGRLPFCHSVTLWLDQSLSPVSRAVCLVESHSSHLVPRLYLPPPHPSLCLCLSLLLTPVRSVTMVSSVGFFFVWLLFLVSLSFAQTSVLLLPDPCSQF